MDKETKEKIAETLLGIYGTMAHLGRISSQELYAASETLKVIEELGYRKIEGEPPLSVGLTEVVDVLQCAREAIVDAICCEDGLDGSAGQKVIDWITDTLGDKNEFIQAHSSKKQ